MKLNRVCAFLKDNSLISSGCRLLVKKFGVKGGNILLHESQLLGLQESGFVETFHRKQGLNQEGDVPSNVLDELAVCVRKRW